MKESQRLILSILANSGETLLASEDPGDRHMVGEMITYLNESDVSFTPEAIGVAGEFFYGLGDEERMEFCLNAADSGFGRENRFGAYRSIYRGLLHYSESPQHYEQQLHNAVFYLKEHGEPLPYLKQDDRKFMEQVRQRGEGSRQALIVRTQGGFSVIAAGDGRQLPWRTRKGRELFAYLLELEGEPVERSRLIEVLWQEEIPDNAVAMLHNMIYNMRKELSAYCLDKTVVYEKRHYRLNMDNLASDSVQVHRMMGLVRKGDISALKAEADYFSQYNGRYLRDIDSPWADACGDAADEAFADGCRLLAEDAVNEGRLEDAVVYYGNILTVSPYEESAAAALLGLYGRQRKWKQLKDCYQNFSELLKEDLGFEPGEEVQRAYRKYSRG